MIYTEIYVLGTLNITNHMMDYENLYVYGGGTLNINNSGYTPGCIVDGCSVLNCNGTTTLKGATIDGTANFSGYTNIKSQLLIYGTFNFNGNVSLEKHASFLNYGVLNINTAGQILWANKLSYFGNAGTLNLNGGGEIYFEDDNSSA